MGIVRVKLPEELEATIERQVALGRVESADAYLLEAARRFAADLEIEDEVIAEAQAGIADAAAERFVTITTHEDAAAWHARMMANLRDRLPSDQG